MLSADFGNDYNDETAIIRNDSIATAALSRKCDFTFQWLISLSF